MVTTAAPTRDTRLPSSTELQRQVQQGHLVRSGSHGEAVSETQNLLKAHGFNPGSTDGVMGSQTRNAVEAFQRSRGIRVDGVVGSETLRELRTPTSGVDARRGPDRGLDPGKDRIPGQTGADFQRKAEADAAAARQKRETGATANPQAPSTGNASGDVKVAPKGMSEREKWDHYASIVRANGGQVNPDGKPTILGIRGMDVNGNKHESTNNRKYDDTFVVLTADHKVVEMRGATHAGQKTTSLVDHVGRINAGNYTASPNGSHNGMPSFHVKTLGGSGNIPGVRDRNNDGTYGDAEVRQSKQRGDSLSAILFHVGFEGSPKSIGCQTLPPDEMKRLLRAVGGRSFSFSLVDA